MAMTTPVRVEALVDTMAVRRPDHPALIFGERRWTYAQLRAEMDRRAAVLVAAGLRPGDIAATIEATTDDLAIAFLACCRADVSLLYLSPTLAPAELTPLLGRAPVGVMLTAGGRPHPAGPTIPALPLALPGEEDAAAAREAARRSAVGTPDAIALIQATSGTTGSRPKLVCLPHRNQTWLHARPAWWELPGGVYYWPRRLSFTPRDLSVIFGVGGTVVLADTLDPGRMEAEMAACRATMLWAVPAIVRLLTELPHPAVPGLALRVIRTGAAPLSPQVARAATARYGAQVVQGFASTEGGLLMGTPQGGAPEGSIGVPYPGVAARIVDDEGADLADCTAGELIVRSPGLMRSYLGDPEATARALRGGWLWTGDLARRDADGCYFLEGRRALRINVGGFKVAPEEVEAVLEQHPAVREVVVLGAADAARGEIVRAVIVPEGVVPSVADLRRYCRERLAGYKVPRVWEFRAELPRSPLGKVLRHLL